MNQPVRFDWDAIRAMWEAGESASSIGRKDGMPSKQAICQRVNDEHWQRIDELDATLDIIPFEGLSDTQRLVVREMAKGLPQKWAAAIAGVAAETVTVWKAENPQFLNASRAAVAVMARKQLDKITDSTDWRSGMAMLERHPATRDDFAPANAHRGMIGTTFNVLGHVNLGFDRIESEQESGKELIEQ